MQAFTAGAIAVLVGYASSVAIVWQALQALGASVSQAALALAALSAGQGFLSLYLSYKSKTPLLFAWSTPGAALLISAGVNDFSSAMGAFIFAAALGIAMGLLRGLSWVMRLIPTQLASALLAGILLRLAMQSVEQGFQQSMYVPVASMWVGFFLMRRLWNTGAIFVMLLIAIAWSAYFHRHEHAANMTSMLPGIGFDVAKAFGQHQEGAVFVLNQWLWPSFDLTVMLGLGLPLFLVTLTGQNMAGLAAIKSFGYSSNPDRLLVASSLLSAVAAMFGGHALNLAAITAALCLGPQAGESVEQRWKASAWAGVLYLLIAGFALWVIKALMWLHPVLVLTLASIALMSSMTAALQQAYQDKDLGQSLPQTLCLLVVLSGVQLAGLGSAFWGLCFGKLAMLLQNPRPQDDVKNA